MPLIGFLRSSLFFILQCLLTICFGLIALLLLPFPFSIRYSVITLWSKWIIGLAKNLCGIRWKLIGKENLPDKPAIIVSNHQSAWETLFLQVILPRQTWVLKKELLLIPFFGWGLWAIEPIAIDRKKSSSLKQLVKQGKQKLDLGRWVVLFPEGSRMPVGQLGTFSKAGALLSLSSNYPVIPMVHNAGSCWPRKAFIKKPGTITVKMGKPIYPQEHTVASLASACEKWITENIDKL